MKKCLLVILTLSWTLGLTAQESKLQKVTLSGYVRDSVNGETMIGANIYVKDDVTKGTITNQYGFYSLTLLQGKYTIICSYLGYKQTELTVDLAKPIRKNFDLAEMKLKAEVVVTAKRKDENIQSTEMGKVFTCSSTCRQRCSREVATCKTKCSRKCVRRLLSSL